MRQHLEAAPAPATVEPEIPAAPGPQAAAPKPSLRSSILRAKSAVGGVIRRTFGDGHAWAKHGSEFAGIKDESEFDTMVQGVQNSPDETKALGGGRTAYWKKDTIVIINSSSPDRSTCFKPKRGKAYFDEQV